MKWLAAFIAICTLLAGVLAWQLVALPDPDASLRSPHAASFQPMPVDRQKPEHAPPAPTGESPDAASLRLVPTEAPPAAPDLGPGPQPTYESPARSAIHWAADPDTHAAEQRLAAARDALADDPHHPAALRDAAAALSILKRWDEAAALLASLVELDPNDLEARHNFGLALMHAGRWSAAADAWKDTTQMLPDDPRTWHNLAACCQRLGRLADAETAWTRVLALAPDSLEALRQRGAVHLDLHDWRGAAADFSRAIDIDADAADLRLNLALALDQAGDSATARRVLTELIERESRNTAALNRRAAILWRQSADPSPQDPALRAAAIADWRRSLAANPDQPEIRSLLDAALTDGQ